MDSSDNIKGRAAPTEYAIAQGAWKSQEEKTEDGTAAGGWLLRSPGASKNECASVRGTGSLIIGLIYYKDEMDRPVLWLDLDSGSF